MDKDNEFRAYQAKPRKGGSSKLIEALEAGEALVSLEDKVDEAVYAKLTPALQAELKGFSALWYSAIYDDGVSPARAPSPYLRAYAEALWGFVDAALTAAEADLDAVP